MAPTDDERLALLSSLVNFPAIKRKPVVVRFLTLLLDKLYDPAGTSTEEFLKTLGKRANWETLRDTAKRSRRLIQEFMESSTHFTLPGTDPKTLGIDLEGRHLERWGVTEPIDTLESTVADFQDGVIDLVGGRGGGIQIILPRHWLDHLKKIE